jgi:hypothetical protein
MASRSCGLIYRRGTEVTEDHRERQEERIRALLYDLPPL